MNDTHKSALETTLKRWKVRSLALLIVSKKQIFIHAGSSGGELHSTAKRYDTVRWSALPSVQRASEVIARRLAGH